MNDFKDSKKIFKKILLIGYSGRVAFRGAIDGCTFRPVKPELMRLRSSQQAGQMV